MKEGAQEHRQNAALASTVREKIGRIAAGHKPRVLDLFSGCGGLSLGFKAAGFEIAGSLEQDANAARSHGLNFHDGDSRHCEAKDITKTAPADLVKALGLPSTADTAFDIVVGGPPCQAFARVGRSKLREIAEHPEAFRHDPRSLLYIEYLKYVRECRPIGVVMENVPDMMNFAGHNIAEETAEVLAGLGYSVGYTLLNAAFYGVPQMRERMFLIALHREVAATVEFPKPTNWMELPPGYEGSRAVALKVISQDRFVAEKCHFQPTPAADRSLPAAVTAKQATEDLPAIDARTLLASGKLRRGTRRFTDLVPYTTSTGLNPYAILMRNWEGYSATGVKDHLIRYLPRDYELFARMEAGDQYPEAHQHAKKMFREAIQALEKKRGHKLTSKDYAWKKLRKQIVPPYDPSKFPNKWRKMEPDRPARTLMAHLGKDSYSHIHHDSAQARTISVREAARFQSFPDGFVFAGTMNPAFKQIGNAVPPLLAKAVATSVLTQINASLPKKSAKKVAV